MTNSARVPGQSEELSSLETFHNSFHWFIDAVRILSGDAETQCAQMGDYNVAWELKNDVGAGIHLASSDLLTAQEQRAILRLVASLDAVPEDVLAAASGREANLAAMRQECWLVPRMRAGQALEALRRFTEENVRYLGKGSAP